MQLIDLLTPALSSFWGGEGENGGRVRMRPLPVRRALVFNLGFKPSGAHVLGDDGARLSQPQHVRQPKVH